jgi:hypothetical protein
VPGQRLLPNHAAELRVAIGGKAENVEPSCFSAPYASEGIQARDEKSDVSEHER